MKALRHYLASATVLLLAVGYAASQIVTFQGQAVEYSHRIEHSAIPWASTGLLIVAVALALIRDRNGVDNP